MRVLERILAAHPVVGPLWMKADVVELDDGRPGVRVEHWCEGRASDHFRATAPIVGGSREYAVAVAGERARKFMFDAYPELVEVIEACLENGEEDEVDAVEQGRN